MFELRAYCRRMSNPLLIDKDDIPEGLLDILRYSTSSLPHLGGDGVEVYKVQSSSLHTSSHRLLRTRAFRFLSVVKDEHWLRYCRHCCNLFALAILACDYSNHCDLWVTHSIRCCSPKRRECREL